VQPLFRFERGRLNKPCPLVLPRGRGAKSGRSAERTSPPVRFLIAGLPAEDGIFASRPIRNGYTVTGTDFPSHLPGRQDTKTELHGTFPLRVNAPRIAGGLNMAAAAKRIGEFRQRSLLLATTLSLLRPRPCHRNRAARAVRIYYRLAQQPAPIFRTTPSLPERVSSCTRRFQHAVFGQRCARAPWPRRGPSWADERDVKAILAPARRSKKVP